MLFSSVRIIGIICVLYGAISSTFAAVTISANDTTPSISARKNMIESVLQAESFHYSYQALSIFIDAFLIEPRGKMHGRLITLSSKVSRDSEFLKLFVHEFWHFIDIYILRSTKNSSDPSENFYFISWKSSTIKKPTESIASFVSGYALTNQYEDFAESLVFYVFHNRMFEDRAMKNDSMRQKYLFFQKYLFSWGAFTDSDYTLGRMPAYSWDTTKIPISLQKYLYSLE